MNEPDFYESEPDNISDIDINSIYSQKIGDDIGDDTGDDTDDDYSIDMD